ncbi:MAG TPA: ThuA domain-containing protein [Verrucomicrobiae bacterium]|nr:ThuA domain-containing protein [Verrucomicrobiae bacterium]
MRYLLLLLAALPVFAKDWVEYEGKAGPGKGRHIVLLSGDEEYRSEEALPMLGKILSQRHGFKCTVLFPINPTDGTIDPNVQTNISGFEKVKEADLLVLFFRFRELPDEQMKYFVDHINAGKPIIAIRTSTHSFQYSRNKNSAYAKYDWRSKEWEGGFGQHVLGDTWVTHHGDHGKQSTRGIINKEQARHPVLRGVEDIWGPTDVYGIVHLPPDAKVLVYGQILEGMKPTDKPIEGKKNDPMMPLIWTRDYQPESGKTCRTLTSTIGAAPDMESEGLRRLFVNACYWLTDLDVPPKADVTYVGEYKPTFFGFNKGRKGVKPAEHELKNGN